MTSIRKKKQTNKQASKLRSKHVVLTCQRSDRNQFHTYAGIWLSGIILPGSKTAQYRCRHIEKVRFFIIYLLFKCSICLTDPDILVLKLRYTQVSVQAAL